jgi:autotransporter strand-loop-strand O-heptosyltransferase
MMIQKFNKAYILYANDAYFEIVCKCIESIRAFSDLPVILYMLNSEKVCDIKDVTTHSWYCDINNHDNDMYEPVDGNSTFYINRSNETIYNLLIQRPAITAHALHQYAETVAYIDSDGVVTPNIDSIFTYYDNDEYPYLTEGVYDYLFIDGRGSVDLDKTLEKPACDLFNADQAWRRAYRTTNMYVAGQKAMPFIKEWWWMCNHPTVLADFKTYAPFHEETLCNVLLWKHEFSNGLPLLYINGSLDTITEVENYTFTGQTKLLREWTRFPAKKENVLFIHGEKRLDVMDKMIEQLKGWKKPIQEQKKLRILFLAPHLSTGGMPSFLLKRIESLKDTVEIFVVEYQNYSMDYVVQRNAIINLVGPMNFATLYEDKMNLFRQIDHFDPDIIHIDEMSERLDPAMIGQLYSPFRKYRIVETCHDISFVPSSKINIPDLFLFCSPYHLTTFKDVPGDAHLIEFPIDHHHRDRVSSGMFDKTKTHVLNVGLWTAGKNQGEGIDIARRYPEMMFHFVGNQAGNFKDYWEPLMKDLPINVTVWGERNDISTFLKNADIFMFNSLWECNPLVLREAIGYGMPIIARNLPQYERMFDKYIQPIDTDLRTIKSNYKVPTDNTSKEFGEKHLHMYTKLMDMPITNVVPLIPKVTISQHFVNNPFLEIRGESTSDFLVKFFDEEGICQYENTIKSNHWVKLNRSWYTKWTAKVWENGNLIYENTLDYTGKQVLISFESESLGDTICWIPYVLEFQKKHNCIVIVSTFKNFLFEGVYPQLQFVKPGTTVNNLYGMYRIGWFYNPDKEPVIPNTIPLQQTITNILGLSFTEIVPNIAYIPKSRQNSFKYVAIATNSTAGCKFWVKAEWQKLVNHLVSQGYRVINISKERNDLEGVTQIKDTSMENTMHIIFHSEFVIGLSSGLSWLAWAMGKRVVMISNFTEADHEFQYNCTRITNTEVCHGCWNERYTIFNKADWNWCKYHEHTPRKWECHTSITSDFVIQQIQHLLK